MEEAQRLLNPRVLHLQKLALELKCPLCLQLFNRPVLLPCIHIFCSLCMPKAVQVGSECPVCKHQYFDREVKPALFMENIVTIYRSLDATFNANHLHPMCSDDGHPASFKMDGKKNPRKESVDISQDGNSSNRQSMILQTGMPTLLYGSAEELGYRNFEKCTTPESNKKQGFKTSNGDKPNPPNSMSRVAADRHMEIGASGIGFIRLEQLSPPLSSDSKDMDGNGSDPSSTHTNAGRYTPKRPVENDAYDRCTSGAKHHTNEVKRQKKTTDRLNDTGLEKNGHLQTNTLASEKAAITSLPSETKSVKPLSSGKSSVDLDLLDSKSGPCVFCHSSKQTEGSGPLVSFAQGRKVESNAANLLKATHVHEKCYTWAPRIFFKNGLIQNLESEVARANKLKCSTCGKKGAVLGCYMKSCPRSYHVPCAYDDFDCRWDCVEYLLLCPKHASHKFPGEQKSKAGKHDTIERASTHLNPCNSSLKGGKNLVLCGSALSLDEKCSLVEFARNGGTLVSKYWRPNVTHVIAAVDSNGACTRTLKVLMAILNGKWIVTVEWVKACVKAGCVVNEEPYEVQLDTHGCSGGPKAGRLRILNNGPKLFNNFHFYFIGDFVQAFKTDLLNLVTTAGGAIIETKDQLLSSSNDPDADEKRLTLVVYNADVSDCSEFEDGDSIKFQRLASAEDVARECRSQIVGHTWILESIAGCSVVPINPSKV